LGKKRTKTTCEKISRSLSGENSPNFGKKRDPAIGIKISEAKVGRKTPRKNYTPLRVKVKCIYCGTEVEIYPYRVPSFKYCSLSCRYAFSKGKPKSNAKTGVFINCLECGKSFYKYISDTTRRFCSKQCAKKGWSKVTNPLKGEKHPFWKGGITPEEKRIRNSVEFKEWSAKVKEVWDYTCQICGERGGRLESNHIKKFADYPELRFETTNGIVLCERCHRERINRHEGEWESYFNFRWDLKQGKDEDFIYYLGI
jgi:endogenous inhibitor of DNA gyrase (YacG/DUF329 family)